MTTEPHPPETSADPQSATPETPPAGLRPSPPKRRTGKIAELPKELRALVNRLLDHGPTYAVVAADLERKDPKRQLNGVEREAFLDQADDLFGFKSFRRLQREQGQAEPIAQVASTLANSPVPSPSEVAEDPSCSIASKSSPSPP